MVALFMVNLYDPKLFELVLEYYGMNSCEQLYKIVCPFHADKNASLQINKGKCFWYCYACGAKGGILELVKKHNPNWSDIKCISFVVKLQKENLPIYNNVLYNNIYNYNNINVKNISFVESIRISKGYYESLPSVNWFKIGNANTNSEEARECKTYMLKRGFTPLLLKQSGAKPSLNPKYPICIPLLENQKFMGYILRTFNKEIEQQRKYMYNKGFKRERTLAGTYTKGKPLLLVEGYLDALKAKQFGIKNVCAILGWKLSPTQFKKIKQYQIPLLICGLDSDSAGNKGYNYLKFVCKGTDIKVKRLYYPKGIKDFGDLKKGSKELEQIKRQLENIGGN